MKELLEMMRKEHIATKWYELGAELLENNDHLEVIKANHRNDVQSCCHEMFQKWLDMKPNASWSQLVTALSNIEMTTAAVAIIKRYETERKSVEYEAFIQFHNELNKVLRDKSYIPHFVPTRIISLNDVHRTSNLPDNERAMSILKNISRPLECGDNQNFYKMLEVIQDHGNPNTQKLVEDIKALIDNKDPSIRSTGTAAAPTEDKESVEYNALINFYGKLATVFHNKCYLFHFVSAGIIPPDSASQMNNLPDTDRAVCILNNISTPLECGEKQSFYKMLEIMQTHGNLQAQQLAEDINASVRGEDPVVKSKTTGTAATVNEGDQQHLSTLHSSAPMENKGPGSTIMDSTTFTQNEILQQEPKIGDLFEFVVPKVKAHWEDVAYTALRYDIPTVEAIQKKHQNDVKKCCQEMFKIWLTTAHGVQPKTWSTLIAQLKKVEELMSATEVIEKKLKDLML